MAKIYRRTDRIPLKIGEVTIEVAPLTFHQKSEVQLSIAESSKKGDTMGVIKAAFLCVKYAVKGISGVELADGSPYKLELKDDALTDECVNDLFSLEESDALSMVCINLMQGRYKDFIDPDSGNKLAGVEVIEGKKSAKKRKRTVGS